MSVHPACDLPNYTLKNKGKQVIINLQKTKYDDVCAVRIFGKVDTVMSLLMEELKIEIPKFGPGYYTQKLEIGHESSEDNIRMFIQCKDTGRATQFFGIQKIEILTPLLEKKVRVPVNNFFSKEQLLIIQFSTNNFIIIRELFGGNLFK